MIARRWGSRALLLLTLASSSAGAEEVPIIVDTDIKGDVDDVGALAILHAMADNGEARIAGVIVDTASENSAPCVDVINTWYGRPDIPIGTLKPHDGTAPFQYQGALIDGTFPHDLLSGVDAPDGVTLYRRLLAAEADGSVVVVSIGFLTVLKGLLQSSADDESALDGVALVKAKVKRMVVMGGGFPTGNEYNFYNDAASTKLVVETWPTPVVYGGKEIGETVISGRKLGQTPASNPVRKAYDVYSGANGRNSWDPTTMLFAVRDGAGLFKESEPGTIVVESNGENSWMSSPSGIQTYLIKTADDEAIEGVLEDLMIKAPGMQGPVGGAPGTAGRGGGGAGGAAASGGKSGAGSGGAATSGGGNRPDTGGGASSGGSGAVMAGSSPTAGGGEASRPTAEKQSGSDGCGCALPTTSTGSAASLTALLALIALRRRVTRN